ncbi:MAG TPA: 6-phosphogluconolactonase [Solirubrobacteraceae bacterium]|nr:6-phosphogluconolactonase [Solirubrobacteraceae bacterium]
MSVSFEVVEDPAHACAAMMVGVASGGGDIVLAGGSTPKSAYGHFVEAVQKVGVGLEGTTLWLGDERCVDPSDERSNYRMIRESLLDPLGERPDLPVIHPMHGELGPEVGAADYARLLAESGPPRFDLLLVGIGPDAHILSLFPGQATVSERERLVVGVPEAGHEPLVPRVSMTLGAVALARQVVLLATGESKAQAIEASFGPDAAPDPGVPCSLLPDAAKDLVVLIDPAAASRLPDQGAAA